MDAIAAPGGIALEPGYISLSALAPGTTGVVISVGSGAETLSPLDRRLLEFGFCSGEQIEILAESRPGRDPFVVRVGNTTLALRRCEAENIWVDIASHVSSSRPPCPSGQATERVDIASHVSSSRPPCPSGQA
ncbi:MAG: ferrous iron transport protein A, partial [Sinobacteraceae bacterium]|nr:ferrous iron transport protein A [Nevskiaceae bacterium]